MRRRVGARQQAAVYPGLGPDQPKWEQTLSDSDAHEADADLERLRGDASRPVTISVIAESAGVSIPTVSKVINRRAGVSADTRARVEAAIDQYGYRRPTSKARSRLMELVFPELASVWAVEIIRGVEQVARANQVRVLVSQFGLHDSESPGWLDEVPSHRPGCVIRVAQLSAAEREQLQTRGIPFVVFDPTAELPAGVPFVGATNWTGGQSAISHLVALGHHRIAMISGPESILFCRARLAGYRSALETARLPYDPDLVAHTQYLTREDGHAAARILLSRTPRPTAIFASNDLQALGVYQAAREAGLRIPDDLSVVGFDDLPIAAWADPPLTTVHQPLTEMAAAATEMALDLGRGIPATRTGLELATTLVVRDSTAPPLR
ncbi:LacI family DNA-binding transcriptional regulator [Dactylosporangium aurantiacum]|uniref:LacI family DNA-binding transcriptional regulator n=1 Tax=Dactylosporangium aurantiacum TaxID=35754 RepID=UPI000A52E0CA|nr:LacI family DNA-binding transcriptional regulator [Dactylosporangium aurantiacum]MDG6103946.1 LacI family DNA-binding transcriptional regulator [Dactylosporangium aurantiacum]